MKEQQWKAIIADDEELLRQHLREGLSRLWSELIVCCEAANGLEATRLIATHSPDILFLDIRMPGLSGLEVAKEAPEFCHVVFVTAYDQYAIDAFENAAVDYLLKPVTDARLARTVTRLRERLTTQGASKLHLEETLERVLQKAGNRSTKTFLKWVRAQDGDGVRLIPVDDVCYFQASDKYTVVMTASEEFLIRTSIRQLAEELDPDSFWLIHRKSIVNARQINGVGRSLTGRHVIHLKDRNETLTASRAYSHLFKQM